MNEEIICCDCEEVVTGERYEVEEKIVCGACYDNYSLCEGCGEATRTPTDIRGSLFCEDCVDMLPRCRCCDEPYDDARYNGWGDMCAACAEEHFECDHCGGTFHNDDYGGDSLCRGCWDETREPPGIREYHDPPNLVFLPTDREPLYFGVELETDNYTDRERAASALYKLSEEECLFWQENDGSLSHGIEIISQPCTLDYHRTEFPWTKISEIVKAHGGNSHNAGTCGLHIHFTKSFLQGHGGDAQQVRLVFLFEKFWDELVKFSRRTERQLERNAQKYKGTLHDMPARKKTRQLRQNYSRYYAVNLKPPYTIEIRLFRGTLNVATILASIELTDFLVRLVKKESTIRLQKMTWANLVKRITMCDYVYLSDALERRWLNVLNSSQASWHTVPEE